jgi:site-specific DNA recombinase
MKAAIYVRKSTEQLGVADEQKSVARQIEHARQYAERKGWTVDEEHIFVDDGISGAEFANRPGYLRLLNALKPRPAFQALVMSEESRLGREAIETAYALKQLVTAGVRVFFYLEDRERTLDSPTDKIMLSLTAFADELEREKARQRTYDAMLRKARAGHVTGGRVFGYDNVEILDANGKRSHVEHRINEREAAVVRRIFELSAAGHGVRAIAKQLNAEGAPAPKPRKAGRPVGWSPSSLHAALKRQQYRGERVWNQSQKRDKWGRKNQQPRVAREWIRIDAPELRIVSEALWTAAHTRRAGANEDYLRRNKGRAWGRPVNGTKAKYLLTGLAQCSVCGGGLIVQTRSHGKQRAGFYVCSSFQHRGKTVCANNQALSMTRIDYEVLAAFRRDLLNPKVLERAFVKVRARLLAQPTANAERVAVLTAKQRQLGVELGNLSAALAGGAALSSVLDAIREREAQRSAIATELAAIECDATAVCAQIDELLPMLRQRDWRVILTDQTEQARQMLRTLLEGRLVFTPRPEIDAVEFRGTGNFSRFFAGLIGSPQALASPTGFEPVFWP